METSDGVEFISQIKNVLVFAMEITVAVERNDRDALSLLVFERNKKLAKRSCTVPSAGSVRPPYPAIRRGRSGVITIEAAPAFH